MSAVSAVWLGGEKFSVALTGWDGVAAGLIAAARMVDPVRAGRNQTQQIDGSKGCSNSKMQYYSVEFCMDITQHTTI